MEAAKDYGRCLWLSGTTLEHFGKYLKDSNIYISDRLALAIEAGYKQCENLKGQANAR